MDSTNTWTPAKETAYQNDLEQVEAFNARQDAIDDELAVAGFYILWGADGYSVYAFDGGRRVVEGRVDAETCLAEMNKIFATEAAESADDDREEAAALCGLCGGCDAYNDAMGY